MSRYFNQFRGEHRSPHGSLHEPILKECHECSGSCHIDGETCYYCDGTGLLELSQEEEQMHHESELEERYGE